MSREFSVVDSSFTSVGDQRVVRQRAGAEVNLNTERLRLPAGLDAETSAAELAVAARQPGPARAAVERAGRALGIALANGVNMLDVDDVVLGGQFIPLLPALRPALEDQLRMRVLAAPWLDVALRGGAGDRPALTGAAYAVLEDVVARPSAWIA